MVENCVEIFEKAKSLETQRLLLRKFNIYDGPDVLEFGSDKETLKYLIWDGVENLEQAQENIRGYYANPGVFAIEIKLEKKCIGCIDMRPQWPHEKMSFGYCASSKYWGKGYMSEALRALICFCFEELQMNRVEASHYVGNEASGRVMEKCGLLREGMRPQNAKVKGRFVDEVLYGVLREKWMK